MSSEDTSAYEYSTIYVKYPFVPSASELAPARGPALSVVAAHNDYEDGPPAAAEFLQWPTVLECEAVPGASAREIVSAVRDVLQGMWSRSIRAVAVCDFEDELPDPPEDLAIR
ncbi:hypothetical protein [Streptomyces sp. NPDC058701]|uniref:hypothetical protein n=1 Tax=Streptomyces sp. NPDC058701 TaxID=3346608 RepID=UPI0036490CF3